MTNKYLMGDPKNEKEQSEFCKILDDWYLNCKEQFKGIHPLGMRKEDLKGLVCEWIKSKNFNPIRMMLVGDSTWTQMRTTIIQELNKCTNNTEFCRAFQVMALSLGKSIDEINMKRAIIGEKPLSLQDIDEIKEFKND